MLNRHLHFHTSPHKLTEIGVFHGFFGRQSLLMVISQEFVQKVQDFWADQVSVFTMDEILPALPRVPESRGEKPVLRGTQKRQAQERRCSAMQLASWVLLQRYVFLFSLPQYQISLAVSFYQQNHRNNILKYLNNLAIFLWYSFKPTF